VAMGEGSSAPELKSHGLATPRNRRSRVQVPIYGGKAWPPYSSILLSFPPGAPVASSGSFFSSFFLSSSLFSSSGSASDAPLLLTAAPADVLSGSLLLSASTSPLALSFSSASSSSSFSTFPPFFSFSLCPFLHFLCFGGFFSLDLFPCKLHRIPAESP